jgi:6-pyruvoyltetrahydropterin/6-carboxytetrahydropterin synthase
MNENMYVLKVESNFCAAHKLIDYTGVCNRLHGHNWKVILSVKTGVLDELGMGLDFKELRKLLEEVIDRLDHELLNEVPPFDRINPTAEHITTYIYEEVEKKLPAHIAVDNVELYESEKYSVRFYKDNPAER